MNQINISNQPDIKNVISTEFIDPGFNFWFSNNDHIRSPFPLEIRPELRNRTSSVFFGWIDGLKEKELSAMKDEEFAEMFETILFNEALKMVEDEDKRLTIAYPFLPRLGDLVNHNQHGKGEVVARSEKISEGNKKLFEIAVLSQLSGTRWETQFELPD